MRRDEILDRAGSLAAEYEARYRGCAQSVLAALQDVFDMRDDEVFKAASGLSGGSGLSGMGSCGALSGGVMAIGILFGRERNEFDDPGGKRMVAYRLASQLCDRFAEAYGSVVCREIQTVHLGREFDLWDRQDYMEFDDVAYKAGRCPELVDKAARWAAEIIMDEMEKRS